VSAHEQDGLARGAADGLAVAPPAGVAAVPAVPAVPVAAGGSPVADTAEPSDEARRAVLQRIERDTRFVLATHENPDGDALGSLIGVHGLLAALGKDVRTFVAASDLPLPPEYRHFVLEDVVHEVPEDVGGRTVIFLDCGNIDRSPAAGLAAGAHLVNIDHHHDNTLFGGVNYVVPQASCTAEIVWGLMRELGVRPEGMIADALYIGVVTDTGRFMYENTGPRAHEMAADLIGNGVDVEAVYRRLYEDAPLAKLELLAAALGHVQRFDDGALTLAVLGAEDFQRVHAEQSYSEGIVDHLRSVQGTKVAALVRELADGKTPGQLKISLRATGDDVDVSAIARAHGGGGHRRAAGFSSTLAVEQVVAFLREQIAAQLSRRAAQS
jgi:phosphoesterase RecJ-like protein